MSLFPPQNQDVIYLSRTDTDEPLSSFSDFGFELDGSYWPTVEHYFQSMKFQNSAHGEKIRLASSPRAARRMGRTRLRKVRPDWKKIREVIMTRAVYTKCRTHNQVAEQLRATGDKRIVERNLYDYFWGCGRDGRGHNTYGQVLMNVRKKLLEEKSNQQ